MKTTRLLLACAALSTLNLHLSTAFAQGTTFTYQGVLSQGGAAVNGSNDLTFTLYNAVSGGSTVGTSNVVSDLRMTNGLFTVTLDFGAGTFDGSARWLQIAARPGASTGAYTNLLPRQPITATPYAITASNLSGTLPATQLTGTIPDPRLSASVSLLGGSVDSAEITDGSIVNVDISPAAAIADTKLATISTAGKVADSALSANVALRSGGNSFIGNQTINGSVGIGTASPAGRLSVSTVNGTVSIADDQFTPALVMSGGPAPGILRVRNALEIWPNTNGTVAGQVDVRAADGLANIVLKGDTGRIGIGTTTPARALTVHASNYGIEHTDGTVRLSTYVAASGAWLGTVSAHDFNLFVNDGGSALNIHTNRNATFAAEVTCTALNITSDRNAKEQFKPVNSRAVLDKVARLPISEWQYKQQGDARHIGPMAQDFHAAFAVGRDDKHITTVDADGVALAAIQGLNEKLEEQLRDKDARLEGLEKAVRELQQLVNKITTHDGGAQ